MKLSIIIVNYNVTELLRNCLLSIRTFVQNVEYEVIVIDNKSTDDSWKKLEKLFPEFSFIASENNDGFAKANNKAVEKAKGEYVLLLNPDTALESDQLNELIDFADAQEKFGCLGVRMHDAEGNFLSESKRSIPNLLNSFEKLFTNFKNNAAKNYYRNDIPEHAVAEVDIVTGAFLLIKKKVYIEVGGLDEQYFMYGEDIDLCYTLLKYGYQNWYYGKFSILHHKGESTTKDEVYLERFYGAMQIFVDKYYKREKPVQYFIIAKALKLKHKLALMKLSK